jgi:5-methylcytosine-specific restriction endonuclease McrA
MGRLKTVKPRLGVVGSRIAAVPATKIGGARDRDAGQPWRKWYKTARWQALRLQVLGRDQWTCQQTGVLLVGKYPAGNSPVADHKTPHRGDKKLFWDIDNIQAVSKEYHDREKQRLEHNDLI